MHRANRAGRWTYRIRPAVGSRGCAPCRVWRFSARPEQRSRAKPLPIFAYFLSAEKVWPGFGAAAPMPVQIISLRIYFAEYGEPIQADGRWPSLHPSDGNAAPNPPNKSFPFIIPHPPSGRAPFAQGGLFSRRTTVGTGVPDGPQEVLPSEVTEEWSGR